MSSNGGRAPQAESESRIGFVFQEPTLMPWTNVFNNVLLPLKLKGVAGQRSDANASQRRSIASACRNSPPPIRANCRAACACAYRSRVRSSPSPALLLMDEPFAALDEITRFKLNNDLLQMWQALRTTVVFVTHSVFESVYLSSRIVVMAARPGRVFTEVPIDAPYPRDQTVPHLGRICRALPPHLGSARASDGGGGEP